MKNISQTIYLNEDWKFWEDFDSKKNVKQVRLPHTCKETYYNCFHENVYEMVCGYERELFIRKEWQEKCLLLTFEGAGHEATIYINDVEVFVHKGGYTGFSFDISPFVTFDAKNVIKVKLDTRETLNIPPFGHVIDYMTYGGLYREVSLQIRNKTYIKDTFVITTNVLEKNKTLHIQQKVSQLEDDLWVEYELFKKGNEKTIIKNEKKYVKDKEEKCSIIVGDVDLWSLDNPNLYCLKTTLYRGKKLIDEKKITFGFREVAMKSTGFYLNGEKVKIRGVNRHQSFPYVGYAMPASQQKRDADIIKYDLACNGVRTSHYPQSRHFLDRCDEIGLLVFTEIPGWQHIGDNEWKKIAKENIKEMIIQNRNHPSIFIWGVRINESLDDEAFYTETNQIARALDKSRPTGGVRYLKNSQFLEDVYTYNDFVHSGNNQGIDTIKTVTGKKDIPYLISEYNGHMFPTKAFDSEEHRVEHMLRHSKVLNDINKYENVAGGFAWCMFDYNTHEDFGSGDRICYHGILDMFRNKKLASAVYCVNSKEKPVLEISSSMDIGEHPGGVIGSIYGITNGDSIKVYKNFRFIKEYFKQNSPYKNLENGPILMDDFIGESIHDLNASENKKKLIKYGLNQAAIHGLNNLPAKAKLALLTLVIFYGMKMDEAYQLYNQFIGNWGGKVTTYRFDAIKDGKVVKRVVKMPMTNLMLDIQVDHTKLKEGDTYDVAAISIRAVDQNGNLIPYCQDCIKLKVEGDIELIGPKLVALQGGMSGTYIKSKKTENREGKGKLTIQFRDEKYKVKFQVE